MNFSSKKKIMLLRVPGILISIFLHNSLCVDTSMKPTDLTNLDCMVVPENNYSTMVVKEPTNPNCQPFECWKSQLTVLTKANLTWKYNEFRHKLAKKHSIGGMVKANWHWMLETEAMKILQNCPEEGAAVIETRNVGGLDYDMSCEESILKIPKHFKTQADFVNYFPIVLQIEKGTYFKLPSVSHFGCAVIFSANLARLVCLFCAKADLLSSDSHCPHQYGKEEMSTFPELCEHDFKNSIYGCEPVKPCRGPEPGYRHDSSRALLNHMYAVTDGDNFLIYVDGSAAAPGSVKKMVLGCEQQGGQCAPPLPTWNYVYDQAKMMQLNNTVFFHDNKTFIRYGSYNVFIHMAQVHEQYTEKAGCCTIILIFFLLTAIPVAVLLYFTYVHRKQHPE